MFSFVCALNAAWKCHRSLAVLNSDEGLATSPSVIRRLSEVFQPMKKRGFIRPVKLALLLANLFGLPCRTLATLACCASPGQLRNNA
eukprot:4445900-Amphidinium_carterae.1